MAWPTPQDYNEAVQNPRFAFNDSDLRSGQPELTKLGLPRPISGNFACVYKIHAAGQRWAARCFISEVSDQQRRYEAISEYLGRINLPYTVPFTYIPAGIKVQGRHFPLLKMQWVQGESLNAFVSRSLGYPDTLLSLAKVWSRMMAELKAATIAHGDLQHGNVVVVGDQLRLIDYDGMFVPSLAGKQSNECGHRNYQLPTRTGWDYGPHLDNFSAWVIYVSLVALAVHPELWNAHRGGDECLIFRKEDYVEPEKSALLRDLSSSSNAQLRMLVDLFASLFSLSPQDVPSLDGHVSITVSRPTRVDAPRTSSGWWSDHVADPRQREQQPTEPKTVEETQSTTPDPTWIVESLMDDKPVEALRFQGQIKPVRMVLFGSAALLILAQLLAAMPMSELTVVATCVFGLNLLLCFRRYKADPSLVEYEVFRREAKVFTRQVREHQTLMDSIAAERSRTQETLAAGERAIGEKKRSSAQTLQTALNKALAELTSQLQVINQRRRDIASSETTKLNSIQASLGSQIADLDRRLAGLNKQEADEKAKALAAIQNLHVQTYLSRRFLANSSIPGIGTAYRSRLIYSGFATAADISWSVSRVSGIGPARQSALMNWRQGLEQSARASAPGLSTQERFAIESKYRAERQTLESSKQQLQKQFDDQVAGVRQYFADQRQALNQEEQQLRAVHTQTNSRLQREHNDRVARLDNEVITARNQVAPTLDQLSVKLREAQKHIFSLRWQSAKKEKEGRRYASLRFRDYCHTIITP
jgi:hypothetical protein